LLLTVYKDKESKTGLFDVKVGLKTWKASVLLDKDQISELAPGAASKWGNTEFNIRVQRPTVDRSQDEDPTVPVLPPLRLSKYPHRRVGSEDTLRSVDFTNSVPA